MMIMESKERAEGHIEAFKLALVAHDPRVAPDLYTEPAAAKERIEVEPDEVMLGDTTGEWEFKYDPERAKEVLRDFLGDTTGRMGLPASGLKVVADGEGWM